MGKLNLAKYHLVLEHVDVDREGNVRYKDGRPLKQHKLKNGYFHVQPCIDGKLYPCRVHTLVAVRWLGDPPDGKELVSHLDQGKTNNKVENLAWATLKENRNMPLCRKRQKISHSFDKMSSAAEAQKKKVGQFDPAGNLLAEYESLHAATRETGLFHSSISKCCAGRRKTCGGFGWKYI